MFAAFFLLLPVIGNAQFLLDPQSAMGIREILGIDQPPAPVFRNPPDFMMGQEEMPTSEGIRFIPTAAIRISPSTPRVQESIDDEPMAPHEWSKMTVFMRTGPDGRTLNDQFAHVLSTWIRTTKGLMHGRPFTTTTSSPIEPTSTAMPTTTTFPPPPASVDIPPPPPPTGPQMVGPPPTEFVNREDLFTTKAPKIEVANPAMRSVVEGWPLQAEFIRSNPLIEEDEDQFRPPQTFEEMLKICPMYPETATMFVHQIVRREYSAGFETKVTCRCGMGSHESFFARKSKPLLTDQGPSLDPAFLRSDLIVGRFSCAFPGNICVQTENGIMLRSMDWQAHVYPAVGSGGGWANSYILLMENGTKLEDAETGKVYLGSSQFDGERRKSRLEHSYLRIKSISCDACLHPISSCQR